MDQEQKEELMLQRAKNFFDNFEENELGIEHDIKNTLEEFLPDTHEDTVNKLYDTILTIVDSHTNYNKGE